MSIEYLRLYMYIYIHNVVAPNRFGILYELVEKERILKVKCSHRSSPSLLRSPSFLPPRTKSHGEFLKTLRRRRSFSAKERLLFSCLPSSVFFKSIAGSQIRLDTPQTRYLRQKKKTVEISVPRRVCFKDKFRMEKE